MASRRERILSGLMPSSTGLTLGNFLGAVRTWVTLQAAAETFFFVADLHALTVEHDPAQLRRHTREVAAELLAAGLDPQLATVFVQSHCAEHTELAWVLACLTGFGEASRMTQFKDKGAGSLGLFAYPTLQAADILLYQADRVPVGDDQRQHLELTRTLATRFNARFGDTFTVPEPIIGSVTARIADLADPSRKMSKSAGGLGTVYLADPPSVLSRKIRAAVTDGGHEVRAGPDKPGISNLLAIYAGLSGRSVASLEEQYAGSGYGPFKADLADLVIASLERFQERRRDLVADHTYVDTVLAEGAARARAVAAGTLHEVRERLGLLPARR